MMLVDRFIANELSSAGSLCAVLHSRKMRVYNGTLSVGCT